MKQLIFYTTSKEVPPIQDDLNNGLHRNFHTISITQDLLMLPQPRERLNNRGFNLRLTEKYITVEILLGGKSFCTVVSKVPVPPRATVTVFQNMGTLSLLQPVLRIHDIFDVDPDPDMWIHAHD